METQLQESAGACAGHHPWDDHDLRRKVATNSSSMQEKMRWLLTRCGVLSVCVTVHCLLLRRGSGLSKELERTETYPLRKRLNVGG